MVSVGQARSTSFAVACSFVFLQHSSRSHLLCQVTVPELCALSVMWSYSLCSFALTPRKFFFRHRLLFHDDVLSVFPTIGSRSHARNTLKTVGGISGLTPPVTEFRVSSNSCPRSIIQVQTALLADRPIHECKLGLNRFPCLVQRRSIGLTIGCGTAQDSPLRK
jgi:hypothetical protein